MNTIPRGLACTIQISALFVIRTSHVLYNIQILQSNLQQSKNCTVYIKHTIYMSKIYNREKEGIVLKRIMRFLCNPITVILLVTYIHYLILNCQILFKLYLKAYFLKMNNVIMSFKQYIFYEQYKLHEVAYIIS